jgi:hypothetical protein
VTELTALDVADPVDLWEELGFTMEDRSCWVSGVRHQLGAPGHGVVGWGLAPANGFNELATHDAPLHGVRPDPPHPNGVIGLDHVVIATPNVDRTVAAFEAAGIRLRRTRDAGTPAQAFTQSFFKLGDVVIEVVGDPGSAEPGPSRFWGLTYTVADLDATARALGDRLRPVKKAVQPGRRIATLDRSVGSSVPMAFMSAGMSQPR